MRHEEANEGARERTSLRLRLTGAALGATLLILGSAAQREPAAVALIAYLLGSLLLRYATPRFPGRPFAAGGVGLDVIFAGVLVSVLPAAEPAWALFAVAIGNAGQRFGAWGVVAATAASIATYDIVLGGRPADSRASDLWPIQVLLAIGLICAELVFVTTRTAREQRELRAFVLAQRDVASARAVDELLSRLVTHATLAFGAAGAGIRLTDARGVATLIHQRGALGQADVPRIEVELDAGTTFIAQLLDRDERAEAFIRDLAEDARATYASLTQRDEQRRVIELLSRVTESLRSFTAETEAAGLLARVVMSAESLGGTATVLRRSDGAVTAGAPLGPDLVAAARETRPPVLFRSGSASAEGGSREVAIASAGPGTALVLVSGATPLTEAHLRALDTLGRVTGALLSRIGERDLLTRERTELRGITDQLEGQLRAREDTLASTVHELRTPLTSVTAYGQLIAKNLQSALQQLAQLDRLIGDLRHDPASTLAMAEIDLMQAAREAAQRQRLLGGATVTVSADGAGPFRVNADPGRLGQVLDNLLGNAVKFSPKGADIEVTLRRDDANVVLSVTDEGVGLSAEELQRVFDRYYRGGRSGADVPGLGIGLAVSQEIIAAHAGRIWAESPGVGQGSTFSISLPAASAIPSIPQR